MAASLGAKCSAVCTINTAGASFRKGQVESISDLARIEDVQRTYPSRIIPLAFLAPDITEAILDGRQPLDLSLDRLLETMPLPLAWDAQRKVLGFPAR